MSLKKLCCTWGCIVLTYASGLAQTVSWNAGNGSVTVSGGTKKFATYVSPTDQNVRALMAHLNLYRIVSLENKGWATGISASGLGENSAVSFRIYAYDRTGHSVAELLYGIMTDSRQANISWPVQILLPSMQMVTVQSNDIRKLAQNSRIYYPSTCTFPEKPTTTYLWSATESLRPLRNAYTAFASGKYLAAMADTTTALLQKYGEWPRKQHLEEAAPACRTWYTPLQPVVIEMIVTNATVSAITIPGASDNNNRVTPYELFNVWYNTDYSGLFRSDRPTVAAHRGFWRNAGVAQNSLGAIQAAANRADIDVIELDVRSSSDKKGICFHDDMPQKVLQKTATDHPNASVYDLSLAQLQPYKLYDRFDLETAETLLTLENAFKYLRDHQITKPINLDIGIPDLVPVGTGKQPGRPYFNAVFLEAVGAACRYGLTDRIIFKGKYTYDDTVWAAVRDTLRKYYVRTVNVHGVDAHPIIAYTPKLGDDIANYELYFNDWISIEKGRGIPFVSIVGMEVRLKNDEDNAVNNFMKQAIPKIKSLHYNSNVPLRVGVFSETPTSCSGYWTKSAVEKYVNFNDDLRNNFDWVLNNGYDYLITDIPEVLTAIINARQ
jgi:glycerophosphoryl diester phosphodiesterase